ncbi:MAG TPA: S8 family serine peptidase, partial [Steroidobacteraceae bacterium]|nr:S8 family serine peptidase [Steroidobacteraceae bacterium]
MIIRKLTMSTAAGCLVFGAASSVAPISEAAPPTVDRLDRAIPAAIEALRLDAPIQIDGIALADIDPALLLAEGRQEVIVRLRSPSVARSGANAPADRTMHKEKLKNEQAAFVRRAEKLAPGSRSMQSVQVVLNAVFMEVDAQQIRALASDPQVERIARVANYEMDLSETVPYITATAMQNLGFDGDGVKVAVLDSGVDYTHAAFGGPGTLAAYEAAWGTGIGDPRQTTRDGLFPTAKVVEGYDFVGELWPTFGDLAPDEDPIDLEGHGSHVADIIGGLGGVAPGVDLYAVKVCSAVSSSCSGIALIQGMEYVADPNGDGDTSDRVDIVNMSLGSVYGQAFDDDLALAVDNATALGIMTVASAGNSSDKPYVTGTPAAAQTALSVAQTQVPSASLSFLTLNGVDYLAEFQPWSTPPAGVISGPLQYGNGAGGNLNGCAAFAPGSLAGKVV